VTRITLGDARAAQIGDVMVIMAEAFDPEFGEAWTEPQCSGILILPGVWITIARCDGAPAGFSIARIVVDEAELLLLGVRRDARRQGVGRALLDAFCRQARQRGARRVHLEMRDGNAAARMYRMAGFEQVGRRPNYYRGSASQSFDALTLSRELS